MCDPFLIGTALLAGGTGAQMHGQRQQASAMNRAMANQIQNRTQAMQLERERQGEFDQGRRDEFQQALEKTSGREAYEQGMQEAQDQRAQAYQDNASQLTDAGHYTPAEGDTSGGGGMSGNRVIEQAAAADRAQRGAAMQDRLGAQARLGSLGDTLLGFNMARQPHAEQIQNNLQAARRSAGSLPLEMHMADLQGQRDMNRAQQRGQTAMGLGSLATAIGGPMIGYGAAGGTFGAGGAASGPAAAGGAPLSMGAAGTGAYGNVQNPYWHMMMGP